MEVWLPVPGLPQCRTAEDSDMTGNFRNTAAALAALMMIGFWGNAQAAPRLIEYEYVDSDNCRIVNRLRFTGEKIYFSAPSIRCGGSAGLHDGGDQGYVFEVNKTSRSSYTCRQERGESVSRCSNGDTIKTGHKYEQSESIKLTLQSRVTDAEIQLETSLHQDTKSFSGRIVGTTNDSYRIILAAGSCRIASVRKHQKYSGAIGTRNSTLRKAIRCRVE